MNVWSNQLFAGKCDLICGVINPTMFQQLYSPGDTTKRNSKTRGASKLGVSQTTKTKLGQPEEVSGEARIG